MDKINERENTILYYESMSQIKETYLLLHRIRIRTKESGSKSERIIIEPYIL